MWKIRKINLIEFFVLIFLMELLLDAIREMEWDLVFDGDF
jgi:hypothetical protein